MRKKILVVAMLNSIHTAKWLMQFENRDFDIVLFPSTYFKKLHPQLLDLISGDSNCNYRVLKPTRWVGLHDYLSERVLSRFFKRFQRFERLNKIIKTYCPDTVHALEFQHAGYICLEVVNKYGKNFELISTNWGSDIYYFGEFQAHRSKIADLLRISDKYSSECERDVLLAKKFNFRGEVLPVIPNSGGFTLHQINKPRIRTSLRYLVLVKSYGGTFGRAELVIGLIPELMKEFPSLIFYLYSVTDDLLSSVQKLTNVFPGRLKYSTVRQPISYGELQSLFDQARIYVGCSASDGISTSFLEAMVSGSYPVQTDTSCAQEWLDKGAIASLVPLDPEVIHSTILKALKDDSLVDEAQMANHVLALRHLDSAKIRVLAQNFY